MFAIGFIHRFPANRGIMLYLRFHGKTIFFCLEFFKFIQTCLMGCCVCHMAIPLLPAFWRCNYTYLPRKIELFLNVYFLSTHLLGKLNSYLLLLNLLDINQLVKLPSFVFFISAYSVKFVFVNITK